MTKRVLSVIIADDATTCNTPYELLGTLGCLLVRRHRPGASDCAWSDVYVRETAELHGYRARTHRVNPGVVVFEPVRGRMQLRTGR